MTDGLKSKDPRWQVVFTHYALDLAEGLKNLVMVHNPECIVLGGGIIEGNPRLVNLVRRLLNNVETSMKPMFNDLVIKTPGIKNPGVAGAAAYAMHMMSVK
jgi:predicted NBD/HSP70 family sugar kinase